MIQDKLVSLIISRKHLFESSQLLSLIIALTDKNIQDQQLFMELEREIAFRDDKLELD